MEGGGLGFIYFGKLVWGNDGIFLLGGFFFFFVYLWG
jgi:hypothetical protein